MNCSKDEALLILAKWCENRSNLLLRFQPTFDTGSILLRGQVSELTADGFNFAGITCDISISFGPSTFEFEESVARAREIKQWHERTQSLRINLNLIDLLNANSSVPQSMSSSLCLVETLDGNA